MLHEAVFCGLQITIDVLVPLPVVIERLNHEWNQNNAPKAEVEIGKADIGADERQDAEEDETEGIRQPVHCRDKAGRVAMACHKVDGARHHEEYRAVNRKIMTNPFHDRNADSRKDDYPYNAQVKSASHRLRIERPHQVAIA